MQMDFNLLSEYTDFYSVIRFCLSFNTNQNANVGKD